MNKNLEIEDFDKVIVKTYKNKIMNNDFLIQKSKKETSEKFTWKP